MSQPPEWRPTREVPGYEVSDSGQVRHAIKGTIKGAPIGRQGYRVVNLWHGGKGRVCYVHSLVAEAFIGPRPAGLSVNHVDGNKLNNSPENLEYLSLSDNSKHQARIGLGARGERHGHSKLNTAQVLEIRRRAAAGEGNTALAREFGLRDSTVCQIKKRLRWRHI